MHYYGAISASQRLNRSGSLGNRHVLGGSPFLERLVCFCRLLCNTREHSGISQRHSRGMSTYFLWLPLTCFLADAVCNLAVMPDVLCLLLVKIVTHRRWMVMQVRLPACVEDLDAVPQQQARAGPCGEGSLECPVQDTVGPVRVSVKAAAPSTITPVAPPGFFLEAWPISWPTFSSHPR
jgi:hypothetical protein